MGEFLVIRCLASSSVSVDDMGVILPGKGSTVTVLTSSANVSADLRARLAARQVSLSAVGPPPSKVWPFRQQAPVVLPPLPAPSPSAPAPAPSLPSDSSPEVLHVLTDIKDMLGALLRRPSPPPPEVVAAHVRAISSMASVPSGLPGEAHPQFIPSTILPEDPAAGADIKFKSSDSAVSVDDSVSALKNIRRKK